MPRIASPMNALPDRDALRATLNTFDDRKKKIVGGMIVVMIENPERVKEREWIAEQYTQVALLASEFEGIGSVNEGVERIQAYVRETMDEVLNACFLLFQFTAEDLAPRLSEGVTREDAVTHALTYMTGGPRPSEPSGPSDSGASTQP